MKTLSDWGRERTVALIIIGFLAIVFVLAIVEGENQQREKV